MNKKRRAEISELVDILESKWKDKVEDWHAQEDEYFENMPESLQGSERGEQADKARDALDTAKTAMEELVDALNEAIEE